MGSKPIGYSASRISAIVNLNKYKTPVEAFLEIKEEQEPGFCAKKGYQLPKRVDSAAIRWGHAFEPAIARLTEEFGGYLIINREKFFSMAILDWADLTCHIDGEFSESWDGHDSVIYEGKTTNEFAFAQIKDDKQRWGEPGTDQTPEEYQVQCAVQRICTETDLVKLSVLVFPKPVDIWEQNGVTVKLAPQEGFGYNSGEYVIDLGKSGFFPDPYDWARVIAEMGNFHTYNLESNTRLESEIIRVVQDFHKHHTIPGIPPEPREYDDIRRLLSNPIGTIIPDPDDPILEKCRRYSEVTRQLGASGPLASEKELLKLEITKRFLGDRTEWTQPFDKAIIVDPNGGDILASFSKSGFRTKRAK